MIRTAMSGFFLLFIITSATAQSGNVTGFFGGVSSSGIYPSRLAYNNDCPISILSAKLEDAEYSRYSGRVASAEFYLKIRNLSQKRIETVSWVVTPYLTQRRFFISPLYLVGYAGTKPGKTSEISGKWQSLFGGETLLVQIEKVGFEDGSTWENKNLIDMQSTEGPKRMLELFKETSQSAMDW
jgi:hypothetical protein